MQIIVLGMHRSGTSPLTRIINLMGVYVGTEGTLMSPHQDNPKGFWERNDVYALHQETLKTMGADWDKVAHLDLGKLTADQRAAFDQKARNILQNLDAHRPWVLKDPRLCLLMPLWRPFLETPICVHIYRSPIQVAQSLRTRNGFPIHFGVALWEKYNLTALTNSGDLPRLFVSHQRLLGQPLETVRTLYEQLLSLGVHGLRLPSEKEILAFLDPALYRERGDVRLKKEFVSFAQEEIFQAFEEGTAGSFDSAISLSAGAQATLESYETNEERERQRLLIEETLRTKEAELTTLHQKMTVVEQNRVIEEQTLQQQLAQAEQKRVTLEASRVAEAKAWKQQLVALEESKVAEANARRQKLVEAEQELVALEESKVAEANAWRRQLADAEQKRVTLEASRVAEANAWRRQLADAEQKRVAVE
ncbi:MAG: hypothetical protein HOP18_05360, partial [Deltaproteobacteria bacterium]|nr:hypothetical protein [Deltaproteobacteria bacterium]